MKIKEELSELRKTRLDIGISILKEMKEKGEFPISDVHQLTKKMMGYFSSMKFRDILKEQDSNWLPNSDYWIYTLKEIRQFLNGEGLCLEFLHTEGEPGFSGDWDFCTEEQYINKLKKVRDEISSRIDTYNDKHDGGHEDWNIQLPGITPIRKIS